MALCLVLFFLIAGTSLGLENTQALNVSQRCEEDTNTFIWEINQETPKEYAVFMHNASGRIGGNVTGGDVNQTGSLDHCRSAHGPTFSGQYCQAFLSQGTIQHVVGVCVPDSCSEEDVHFLVLHGRLQYGQTALISPILVNQSIQEMTMTRCLPNNTIAPDASGHGYVACLFVCCLMVAIPLAATMFTALLSWQKNKDVSPSPEACCKNTALNLYGGLKSNDSCSSEMNISTSEEFNKHKPVCFPRRCLERWLQAFSLQNTCRGVFSTTSSIPGGGYSSLNGIRALSLLWIICGHDSTFTYTNNTDNAEEWLECVRSSPFHIITAGANYLAVDTFLVLGGMLSAKSLLGSINRAEGKLSVSVVGNYFFSRIKRIQPLLMFCVCLLTGVYSLVKWGPYRTYLMKVDTCRTHWWANLLFISNLIDTQNLCLPWTWYLSLDFQFYATTPVLLYLHKLNRGVFAAVVGGLLLLTTAAGAILTALKHFPVFMPISLNVLDIVSYLSMYYTKPYTRYGPYLLGILLGIHFVTKKDQLIKKKWQAALGWFCTIFLMAVVFGLAFALRETPDYPSVPHALYQGLHRTVWALAIVWIIVACEEGYGGLIKSVLSLGFWIPISNISFAAYLFHPIVISLHNGVQENKFHFTVFNFMILYFGRLLLSLLIGYMLTVLIEKPYFLKYNRK
ncbi:O-acyltransferase like protein-like [Solea solea]|uniref:O-acyltransferase like protein-like n=1 Tax=Solea solea TaxID=90069 RepID=UPI00272AEBDC|nr:O-acyltransferase like protein-like [Solea solea]